MMHCMTTSRFSNWTVRRARASGDRRRRGSVLVLVVTLLGILFVTGIVFLATVNFEAEIIASDRERDRNRDGVQAVVEEFGSMLRDSLMAAPDVPFGGKAVGESLGGFAELPGVQNLLASVEPYVTSDQQLIFGAQTDVASLTNGPHDGSGFRRLKDKDYEYYSQILQQWVTFEGIDTSWPSGVPVELVNPNNSSDRLAIYPVDADGDGITDTLGSYPIDTNGDGIIDTFEAANPIDLEELGYSEAQIAALSRQLNPPSNATGKVFLGMRVIAHGGMVNLNASHPTLIANVLNLWREKAGHPGQYELWVDALEDVDGHHSELGYFRHQPTLDQEPYSPLLEEAMLRRRMLLPPQAIAPSLLHGNALLLDSGGLFGQAHLSKMLYPPDPNDRFGGITSGAEFETVYEGSHRYWPFTPDEDYSGEVKLWAARMEPFTSFAADPGGYVYDRRHLVTTVSYDDLLSRGGRRQVRDTTGDLLADEDILEKMREANRAADVSGCFILPFEYADYPQVDIPNDTEPNSQDVKCECPTQDVCRFDPRKGRLSLSLAWLDDALERGVITADQQERLIHDAFMMLVRNAQGPYWDEIDCSISGTNGLCPTGEFCDIDGLCSDSMTRQTHRSMLISRTAASLTANMIDYMDSPTCVGGSSEGDVCVYDSDCPGSRCSDTPTRVALRWFDFSKICEGGSDDGARCIVDYDCGGGGNCVPNDAAAGRRIGWECNGGDNDGMACDGDGYCPGGHCESVSICMGGSNAGAKCTSKMDCTSRICSPVFQYVYGLERQPFITEVATVSDGLAGNEVVVSRAVELFNPYPTQLDDDYYLVEVDHTTGMGSANWVQLNRSMQAKKFTVFWSGAPSFGFSGNAQTTGAGAAYKITSGQPLSFMAGWTVYLVRRMQYESGVDTNIVLDQLTLSGVDVGVNRPPSALAYPAVFSRRREVTQDSFWHVPVPLDQYANPDVPDHTLGIWDPFPRIVRPVEVNFANTGSFTRLHPDDDPYDPQYGVAFPTTGSMLLLMRHANRSRDDYDRTKDLAFTTWLDDTTLVTGGEIHEDTQVDNGRMTLFDLGEDVGTYGRQYAHHINPAAGACCLDMCYDNRLPSECTANGGDFWPGAKCSADLCAEGSRVPPGQVEHLPWGQLVFDYFTVLPLSNDGPYTDKNNPIDPASLPRVDMEGLRVHGRININAAPWTVLSGLPLIPMKKMPGPFRDKIRNVVDPTGWYDDDQAAELGESLARGIVAYREAREVTDDPTNPNSPTGDYDQLRGWIQQIPVSRRGTGFLTVGELANVHHDGAKDPLCRIDSGMLTLNPDYVRAVALLASLGDWVTVRSQVFTIYGTLRGEPDPDVLTDQPNAEDWERAAADVDTRAIRFQETVNRLPVFLGESVPARIGQRTMGKYIDVRND